MEIVTPGDEALLYEHRLILAMVTNTLEEDAPCKQRDLQRLDINPDLELAPGVCS